MLDFGKCFWERLLEALKNESGKVCKVKDIGRKIWKEENEKGDEGKRRDLSEYIECVYSN